MPATTARFAETTDRESWLEKIYGAALEEAPSGNTRHEALLRRLHKLATTIEARPTVVGLDIDETTVKTTCQRIADEMVSNSQLLSRNVVAFIRLENADDAHSGGFDDLMRCIMSTSTVVKVPHEAEKEGARLLIGDTGVGKSELARALHQQLASRLGRDGRFVPVNIAAISETLLESRLRGHAKGAFTDAKQEQKGWVEQAHNGTLFLDELQAAPVAFQVQLLDLLNAVSDTVEVARVGEDHNKRRFRVRVVMATNESVEDLRRDKRLREDLFYRIRSMVRMKSLAERLREERGSQYLDNLLHLHRWRSAASLSFRSGRPADPDRLLERLVSCRLPEGALSARDLLREHGWRGNLREFERVCFDTFQSYDRGAQPNWTEQEWRDAFSRAITGGEISSATPTERTPDPALDVAQDRQEAFEMQEILCLHGFNVRAAIPDLKRKRLRSSRGAIRSFLQAHRADLDPARWTTEKARRLLDGRRAG